MMSSYRRVLLWHHEWELDGVVVATSVGTRLRGLNLPGVSAVLLNTASVHTFSVSRPIQVTSIDQRGEVVASSTMKPRRVAKFPNGGWILETELDVSPPPPGFVLLVLPSRHDARNTHALWNADWEPR